MLPSLPRTPRTDSVTPQPTAPSHNRVGRTFARAKRRWCGPDGGSQCLVGSCAGALRPWWTFGHPMGCPNVHHERQPRHGAPYTPMSGPQPHAEGDSNGEALRVSATPKATAIRRPLGVSRPMAGRRPPDVGEGYLWAQESGGCAGDFLAAFRRSAARNLPRTSHPPTVLTLKPVLTPTSVPTPKSVLPRDISPKANN
jgi:hypothetical protein